LVGTDRRDPAAFVPAQLVDRLTLVQLPAGEIALRPADHRQRAAVSIGPNPLDLHRWGYGPRQAVSRGHRIAGRTNAADGPMTGQFGRIDTEQTDALRLLWGEGTGPQSPEALVARTAI